MKQLFILLAMVTWKLIWAYIPTGFLIYKYHGTSDPLFLIAAALWFNGLGIYDQLSHIRESVCERFGHPLVRLRKEVLGK